MRNTVDYEAFKVYMKFVKEIVGRIKWKNTVTKCLIKDFVTVSDEALTLLAIDNSEFVWEAQALKSKSVPLAKYTSSRAQRRIHDGWSASGRKKFNEYYDMVERNRKNSTRRKFENDYISSFYLVSSTDRVNKVDKEDVVTKDELESYGTLVGVAV